MLEVPCSRTKILIFHLCYSSFNYYYYLSLIYLFNIFYVVAKCKQCSNQADFDQPEVGRGALECLGGTPPPGVPMLAWLAKKSSKLDFSGFQEPPDVPWVSRLFQENCCFTRF